MPANFLLADDTPGIRWRFVDTSSVKLTEAADPEVVSIGPLQSVTASARRR